MNISFYLFIYYRLSLLYTLPLIYGKLGLSCRCGRPPILRETKKVTFLNKTIQKSISHRIEIKLLEVSKKVF